MRCDRCHKPVPDDATVWRVSCGYSVHYPPGAVQSWCSACWADLHDPRKSLPPDAETWPEDRRERLLRALAKMPHHRWSPARPCEHCGRPVIFHGSRKIPRHAVCGAACRYAVKIAQVRARRASQRRQGAPCAVCRKPVTQKRVDARFCSDACRQRAYRRRQHGGADKPR